MGWERRRNGRYYYAWVRIGREYRKAYFGSGPAASVAARYERDRKQEKAARTEDFREERSRHDRVVARLNESCTLADLLCRAALILGGYHQHDRSAWRKARET